MSDRLDKLRRLQVAVDDLLAAVRDVDENLDSSEAADLQAVIDEMEKDAIRSKMSIEARDGELKEWNRMWHEQVDEVKRLQAENERLRKAGDAMHLAHEANFKGHPYTQKQVEKAMNVWTAAKEGR